jgi:hypothetical protein
MMAYYNENDGLYYANEEFTTLFTGLDQTSYIYYLNGVQTTLNMHGFGTWNGNFYVEGQINNSYTGWHWSDDSNTFYVNSEATTLDIYGFGTWNANFYVDGQINNSYTGLDPMSTAYYINSEATTLDLEGFGTWNGNFYVYGQINNSYTGPDGWNSAYYVNSEATTLDGGGSGFWSDKAYFFGSEQPTGWNNYFYYIDNVETTLGENGDGEWNGQTYVNGVVQGGGGGGGGGGSVDLESGLQAFYKLSDTSDSSGNNKTLTNNDGVSFASGKIGNAAVFDGTNCLSVSPFDLGTSFSFGCWVNTPELNDYDILLQQFAGAGFYTMADGSIQFGDMASWNAASSSGVLSTNTWHHIVLVSNAGSGTLYVDGASVASDNSYTLDLSDNSDRPFGINGEPDFSRGPAKQIDAVGIWDRALNSAEIAALYNSGNGLELPAPIDLESGLQAFYKLDDTSDSSGNGNTLTNNNNVSFASGKIGSAAVFDGSNYLDVNMASLPQGAQNRTISFWFNSTKTDPQVPLYYGTPTAGELVLFYVDSQSVIVSPYGDGVSSGEIVNDGNWHHLLFKTNNETWMLYIDGELKDSQYRSTLTNGTTLTIGYGSDGNTEGSVDAIGIWDRALNSAEIAALYNSGTGYEIDSAPVAAFVKIQGNTKFYGNVKFVS